MSRRKSVAVDAVTSRQEAAQLLGRYAALSADIDMINAERATKRSLIDADADTRIATRTEELKSLFGRLKPWWAVAGGEATSGKRKSAELGGCQIGVRTSTPKLNFDGDETSAIARLRRARLGVYIRVKPSLDRVALIASLGVEQFQARLNRAGFRISQKEEFFVEPLSPKQDDVIDGDAQ